ncbi:uncharacterized protein LOC134534711 [Bacillus rossius redtenbacheri]|uniref:uncharacterized protein LOC134534711 n=1 Tax=Bacillus rossius redtenbacheri TaxID=93214 RepID=UPI002FDC80C0
MAYSPGRNNLPQETSTPLKKEIKNNAISTPKVNTAPVDCQNVVADFKAFLDELDIDESNNNKSDDTNDSTLEEELSKLETTLKNIELEHSVGDSEENDKHSDCEVFNSANAQLPVLHEVVKTADIITQEDFNNISPKILNDKLLEDVLNHNPAKHIPEIEYREDIKASDCTNDKSGDSVSVFEVLSDTRSNTDFLSTSLQDIQQSKHVSGDNCKHPNFKTELKCSKPVCRVLPKSISESDFIILDKCGGMSVNTCTTIENEDVSSNDYFFHDMEESKHECGVNSKLPECMDEIIGSKHVSVDVPNTSSEADFQILDVSEISVLTPNKISNEDVSDNIKSLQDTQEGKQEYQENSKHPVYKGESSGTKSEFSVSLQTICGENSILTLDECGEISATVSENHSDNNAVNYDDSVLIICEVIKNSDQDDATALKKSNISDKSIISNKVKYNDTPLKEADEEMGSVTLSSAINNIGMSCLKDDISSVESNDEIHIVAEIKAPSLQTYEECMKMARKNTSSDSTEDKARIDLATVEQPPSEEIRSPRKCLNGVNTANEIEISCSASVNSKLSVQDDADRNKENILDKPQVDEAAAKNSDSATKKDVVRIAEEFISHDPEENRDNNNEKWEELRKLTTNPERYRALRKRWQNISNPDPNKNLTTRRCFRKNFIRKKLIAKHGLKRAHNAENAKIDNTDESLRKLRKRKCQGNAYGEPGEKRAKTYPCTILYDEQIAEVTNTMRNELVSVNEAEHEALRKLNFLQNLEQEKLRYREGYLYSLTPYAQQLRNRQETETLVALEYFEKEKKKIEDMRFAELSKLKAAADEIHAFHSFYNGITEDNVNTLLLTEEQVLHLRDIEDYYNKMTVVYDVGNV